MASFILVTRIVKKKKKEKKTRKMKSHSNRIGSDAQWIVYLFFLKGKILHNDVGGIKKE